MIDFRCKKCGRLLGRTDGNTEIACPRCSGINTINILTKEITYQSRLKKQSERTTISGKRFE